MPTVVITDHPFSSIELERNVLKDAGFTLEEVKPSCKTEDDIIQKCRHADALIVQWAPITARVFQALPRVKGVVRYGIGVDNIDLAAAKAAGRAVSGAPAFCVCIVWVLVEKVVGICQTEPYVAQLLIQVFQSLRTW